MKKIVLLHILLVFFISSAHAQSMGMTMLSNWNPDSLLVNASGVKYNDLWGYTDCSGNEYAIVGAVSGVYFINITDPQTPELIDYFEGGEVTTWRDIKTYQNRAYAVSDLTPGGEGLMIFDLSDLPNSVTKTYHSDTLFENAHNLFVDEPNDRLYVVDTDDSPLLILDLRDNLDEPTLIGNPTLPVNPIHDIFVRDHIAYVSHLDQGLNVYDLADPQNPVLLGSLPTYSGKILNHSSWLTEDGKRLVFCDEKRNTNVKIIDVTDLTDLEVAPENEFRSELLAPDFVNSIAHNPYIRDNYAIVSYYHDGIQIFDISSPDTTTRVAYYDTTTDHENYSGWYGAWGAYPFLPSGNIIVSDIHNGLFVLSLDSITFNPMNTDVMPDVNFDIAGPIVPCEGDSIILSVPDGATNYYWYKNDELIAENSRSITAATSGTYYVSVSNGHCEAVSELIEFQFNALPDLSSMQSGLLTPCTDETIIFEAPSNIGFYTWLKDGNVLPNTGSFIQIVESGSYRLLANNGGCSSISEPFMVEFVELPSSLIQATPLVLCEDGESTLSVEEGAELYIWSLNGEVIDTTDVSTLAIDEVGAYAVAISIGTCQTFSEPVEIEMATTIVPSISFINNFLNTDPGEAYQWYFDGNPIEGANSQELQLTDTGEYYVEVLNENGCTYASELYTYLSTSTTIPFNQQIKLFPNPVKDQLFLQMNSEESTTVQLTWLNVVGELIAQESLWVPSSSLTEINLPDIPKGIYLLQIDNGQEKTTRKIFKQ